MARNCGAARACVRNNCVIEDSGPFSTLRAHKKRDVTTASEIRKRSAAADPAARACSGGAPARAQLSRAVRRSARALHSTADCV